MVTNTLAWLWFCVAITLASPECQDPKISSMRVVLTTKENETGHWDTQVAFQQEAAAGGQGHIWVAGVDQNIVQCDKKEPVIETILHLQASPTANSPRFSPTSNWLTPFFHPVAPPPKTPPTEYELFPGVGYYKFHNEKIYWGQAHKKCLGEGGHLMILNSEKEKDVAKQILARHPNAGEWVNAGFLEMGINLEWYTIFGEPLESTGFSRFVPGQNTDAGINDIGLIHRNGDYGDAPPRWNPLNFICEFDL